MIGGVFGSPEISDAMLTPTDTRTAWGGGQFAREFNQLNDRKRQLAYIMYMADSHGRALSPRRWALANRQVKYRGVR